jgi:hypothetical protein
MNLAGRTCIVFVVLAFSRYGASAHVSHNDELANSQFEENRPTTDTTKLLKDELLFQRGTQTYLWALPLDKYARDEEWIGEGFRPRLQHPSNLEETAGRERRW